MPRGTFGGGPEDYLESSAGRRVAGATLTMWTAATGGTRITDLLVGGVAASAVTSDAFGYYAEFQGPDEVTPLYADGGQGQRFALHAHNLYVPKAMPDVAAGETPVGAKSIRGPGPSGKALVQFDSANVEGHTVQMVNSALGTFAWQFHVETGTLSQQGPGDNTDTAAGRSIYHEILGPRPYTLYKGNEVGGSQYAVGERNGKFIISGGDPAPITGVPGSANNEANVKFQWDMAAKIAQVLGGNEWRWFAADGTTLRVTINGENGDVVSSGGLFLTAGLGRVSAPNGLLVLGAASASGIFVGETADTGQIILRRDVAYETGHKLGFFGTAPIVKPTAVAVTAAGVHAALVSLGLIAA